jgi:hypothetical protein
MTIFYVNINSIILPLKEVSFKEKETGSVNTVPYTGYGERIEKR